MYLFKIIVFSSLIVLSMNLFAYRERQGEGFQRGQHQQQEQQGGSQESTQGQHKDSSCNALIT